jgi:hypothetical protein
MSNSLGDTTLMNTDESRKIPSATQSEKRIAQDAPLAISFMRRHGALDLTEDLGLDTHMEGTN